METQQNVLVPGGPDAAAVATLGWVMFGGAAAIFIGVLALTVCAHWGGARIRRYLSSQQFILFGGAVFPAVALTVLLIYGLTLATARMAGGEPGALAIEVTGEQWWWRVAYRGPGNEAAVTANEVHLPAGHAVELTLLSADVIHSFWVPNLAGKVDMIPGTANRLRVRATKAGTYRGQCAEYCGGPHALMALHVVVQEPAEFADWLVSQQRSAEMPLTAAQQKGESLFLATGCGGCHAIRGTAATGTIGPDLTHVGGRLAIGAATLPGSAASYARWIRDNQHIKPNNRMPAFGILSDEDLASLAAYLESLK